MTDPRYVLCEDLRSQLAEARSLIDELAEELAAHYPDPSQWSDCDSGLMMLAKVEAYRKDKA